MIFAIAFDGTDIMLLLLLFRYCGYSDVSLLVKAVIEN